MSHIEISGRRYSERSYPALFRVKNAPRSAFAKIHQLAALLGPHDITDFAVSGSYAAYLITGRGQPQDRDVYIKSKLQQPEGLPDVFDGGPLQFLLLEDHVSYDEHVSSFDTGSTQCLFYYSDKKVDVRATASFCSFR